MLFMKNISVALTYCCNDSSPWSAMNHLHHPMVPHDRLAHMLFMKNISLALTYCCNDSSPWSAMNHLHHPMVPHDRLAHMLFMKNLTYCCNDSSPWSAMNHLHHPMVQKSSCNHHAKKKTSNTLSETKMEQTRPLLNSDSKWPSLEIFIGGKVAPSPVLGNTNWGQTTLNANE